MKSLNVLRPFDTSPYTEEVYKFIEQEEFVLSTSVIDGPKCHSDDKYFVKSAGFAEDYPIKVYLFEEGIGYDVKSISSYTDNISYKFYSFYNYDMDFERAWDKMILDINKIRTSL